jgi:hypothetical protein
LLVDCAETAGSATRTADNVSNRTNAIVVSLDFVFVMFICLSFPFYFASHIRGGVFKIFGKMP